ncbi:MAG: uroporphyrinogen-III C-methyltransferase [Kiloniellales bacterium]|nr:uroporphyrinogen-III C-methyltransferase [Kiloniellales bacterium]
MSGWADTFAKDLPDFEPGWVWLAGAGPGDAGLLTLHAVNGLKQADVIVYDALVSDEVLAFAPRGTVLEYAGKRGGKPSPKQADISQRLVKLAKSGKRVLRLKGGDPFIFGRGGEEALALVKAGVPFRVIPGISAGIGGLSYAGIPATHRTANSAVTFLTGHAAGGAMTDNLNWSALAHGSPVLVIYMALKHLAEIAEKLMRHGRSPEEVVAIVASATLPEQRVLETTLGRCARDAEAHKISPPSLVVIGEVVSMRRSLDWLGALEGRTLELPPDAKGEELETG